MATYVAVNAYAPGNNYFFVDLDLRLANDDVIHHVGAYVGDGTTAFNVKIMKRTAPNTFDVIETHSITPTATAAWQYVTLGTPFTVPSTGDYYVGAYFTASNHFGFTYASNRAYYAGDPTGTGLTFYEDFTSCGQSYADNFPAGADQDTVISTAGGNWQIGNLSVGNVKKTITYGLNSGSTGTLESTDPGQSNVLVGTSYIIESSNKSGTFNEAARNSSNAAAGDIAVGKVVKIQNSSTTGTFNEAARNVGTTANNILVGASITIQNSVTNGTFNEAARNSTDANAATILSPYYVKIQGITYNGTFDETVRNTDPGIANVAANVAYRIHDIPLTGTNPGGGGTDANFVVHSQGGNWLDEAVIPGNLSIGAVAGVGGSIVGTAFIVDPNDALSSAGGNYVDTNLTPTNVRNGVSFGVGETGSLQPLPGPTPGFDYVFWQPVSGGIALRDTPLNLNYPEQADVLNTIPYGYLDQYAGTLLAYPQVQMPTVVGVDREDGSGADIIITDSDPAADNAVYYSWWGQNGVQEWQLVATITGDGTVALDEPPGLYAVRVISSKIGANPAVAVGNLFYISNLTNITRIRIRDAVAGSALKVCYKLGFQADYQTPGRAAIKIWVVPETTDSNLSMLGSTVGTSFSVLAPRQADFPTFDGFAPGSRLGINDTWYDIDVSYPTEDIYYAPTFSMKLYRLNDVTVELDGDGL